MDDCSRNLLVDHTAWSGLVLQAASLGMRVDTRIDHTVELLQVYLSEQAVVYCTNGLLQATFLVCHVA